jgi:hypothetical protein
VVLKDKDDNSIEPILTHNYTVVNSWRTKLYIEGLKAEFQGLEPNPYFEELAAFWPREYNLHPENQSWMRADGRWDLGGINTPNQERKTRVRTQGNYFLDFIDSSAEVGKYSIDAIGKRSDVIQDDKVNCLFAREIPNVVFLNVDNPEDNISENTVLTDDQIIIKNGEWYDPNNLEEPLTEHEKKRKMLTMAREYCNNTNSPWTQVNSNIYSNLIIGGYDNSAYDKIRYELYCHTNFQKQVNITTLPVVHLEPNSRVSVNYASTNTYGDYMIQNINLNLGPGANMSMTLSEVTERL